MIPNSKLISKFNHQSVESIWIILRTHVKNIRLARDLATHRYAKEINKNNVKPLKEEEKRFKKF